MEKSERVCQATLGCSTARAPFAAWGHLKKLRDLSTNAMEDWSGLRSALADDPIQALEQRVGSFAAPPSSAERRRVPLAGFIAGCVSVLVSDVAPDGLPQIFGHLSFRVYVLPQRTTTLAINVLTPQVKLLIAFLLLATKDRSACTAT